MSKRERIEMKRVANVLQRGAELIRAIREDEENQFFWAMRDLDKLARKEFVPIALVGGSAAVHYGLRSHTAAIDINVGKDDLRPFMRNVHEYGFKIITVSPSGWHTLEHGDVEINVVPEGGKASDTASTLIPGPRQLGVMKGFGIACLPGLVEMKLASGRAKDLGHIAELLKIIPDEEIDTCRNHIREAHSEYLPAFESLLQRVKQEKVQEQGRGGVQ